MQQRQDYVPGRCARLAVDQTAALSVPSGDEYHGFGVGARAVVGVLVRSNTRPPLVGSAKPALAADPGAGTHSGSGVGDVDEIEVNGPAELGDRLGELLELVGNELDVLAQHAPSDVAAILGAQAMMAQDPTLVDRLLGALRHDLSLDVGCRLRRTVVEAAFAAVAAQLREVGGYIGERAADIGEIGVRVVDHLFGIVAPPNLEEAPAGSILLFEQLTAAQASMLVPASVRGVVTVTGGPTGHAALILRALDIPAVIGCSNAGDIPEGVVVFLDPLQGVVKIGAPDQRLVSNDSVTAHSRRSTRSVLATKAVKLLANVGSLADAQEALSQGAEGIGLVRTEFLFEGGEREPTIDEQVSTYRSLLEVFEGTGKPVTVRTLDIGSDKPLPFVSLMDEDNPALGVRGFRLASQVPGLLERQLQALAVAHTLVSGVNLRVMAPMISTIDEVRSFMAMARSAGLGSLGVMIEIPTLALDFSRVANLIDFASIGTNDLIQYLMGADRNAAVLGDLLDPWNPVVMRVIGTLARQGLRANVAVSVCGEAASDPMLAIVLVGLGITGLSMAPVALAPVREALDSISMTQARQIARKVIRQLDAKTARRVAGDCYNRRLDE